jgi:hypothetical protein
MGRPPVWEWGILRTDGWRVEWWRKDAEKGMARKCGTTMLSFDRLPAHKEPLIYAAGQPKQPENWPLCMKDHSRGRLCHKEKEIQYE